MSEEIECMCLHCGISVYLDKDLVSFEEGFDPAGRLVRGSFCTECGGQLAAVGKAGDEPDYRLE
jgi:hypothetical protein